MRVIVLAAGQGFSADGMNKLLVRDPATGLSILDIYRKAFAGMSMTVVVGYRAINVMSKNTDLDYVYNSDWAITKNSYSLALALNQEPCYVISGDLIIDTGMIGELEKAGPDIVVTRPTESRPQSAINASIGADGVVRRLYKGKLESISNPEAVGIFKISNPRLLQQWRQNCLRYTNLFVGENLPLDTGCKVVAFDASTYRFEEINDPNDYLRVLAAAKVDPDGERTL